MKRNLFAGLLIAVLVVVGLIGWWAWRTRQPETPRAQVLYEKHCAVCHGLQGDGQGEATYLLQPKPRNFGAGKYRLVSSENLQPTHEDLFRTISNGMPGTPMPSWAHLPESDRRALSDYVLQLNRAGWYERGIELGYSRAEAENYAAEMTDPGEPIAIPPEPELQAQGLREGRRYYLIACANCHGQNGEGRQDPTWRTAEGFPTRSRSLREGVFKGGREGEQLYLRFFTGLPGTPMPSGTLAGEKVWRVVQYIQSLSDPVAQERAQVHVAEVVAARVQAVPGEPKAAEWEAVPSTRIALMPLWWHEGYIDAVRVKAAHDGQRLAFLLEWDDATRDIEGVRQQSFPDGAAVQLTASAEPPLFAMGAAGEPVNIWHWKALWSEDQTAFQDIDTAFPGMVADAYYGAEKGWQAEPLQDPTYRPAAAFHNPVASSERKVAVEDANAVGFGTLTSQASGRQNLQGTAHWEEGVWRLQLVRELNSPDSEDVSLRPGETVSVGFAFWDGSAGDRNGQKSVSIWNTLILE
jgi:mono/diheme cytochrome c family protein